MTYSFLSLLASCGRIRRGLIVAQHLSTHRDGKAVPGVDGGQGKHQRNHLLFVEVRSCALEDRVGHMALRDPGDGVSKRERRAFALGVKRRLLPRVQHIESLLGLAEGAGVFRMHIEAIRTPIDLRARIFTRWASDSSRPELWM